MDGLDDMMKIALLGPYEQDPHKIVGGAHVDTFNLIRGLMKYPDIQLHVITMSTSVEHDEKVVEDNLTVHYLKSPKLPRFITSLSVDQCKVLKKVRELNPDLIHAQCTAPLYGFTASLLSQRYPVLLRVQGIVGEEAKTWSGLFGYIKGVIYRRMEEFALKRISYIVVDTDYVKAKIKSLSNGDVYVVPVGVGGEYFNTDDNEVKDRLLFVGGIEPRKGLIHLLKAVEIVKKKIPTVNLHIIGIIRKQKCFNELMLYVKDKNLADNVLYAGEMVGDGLRGEYSECSIFVLPSKEESQGLVLLEAMASGKPVVASNTGGIPYIVDDGKTGFLVEYGNPEELADKITTLLGDRNLRERMGGEGREKAKQFSQDKTTEKIHILYQKIINEHKTGLNETKEHACVISKTGGVRKT